MPKINPNHSEEWEYDFTDLVPCDHCGEKKSLVEDMIEVRKQGAVEPINLRFCNQTCASDWHMEFLRRNET